MDTPASTDTELPTERRLSLMKKMAIAVLILLVIAFIVFFISSILKARSHALEAKQKAELIMGQSQAEIDALDDE